MGLAARATEPAVEAAPAPRLIVHDVTIITSTVHEQHNHATICAAVGNSAPETFEGRGIGPIDAMCKAFDPFAPGFEVIDWEGKAQGRGSDAVAMSNVSIMMPDGGTYHGAGKHPNTMQSTASAIADALSKHLYLLHHRK
jgi:hypothetical protein